MMKDIRSLGGMLNSDIRLLVIREISLLSNNPRLKFAPPQTSRPSLNLEIFNLQKDRAGKGAGAIETR